MPATSSGSLFSARKFSICVGIEGMRDAVKRLHKR